MDCLSLATIFFDSPRLIPLQLRNSPFGLKQSKLYTLHFTKDRYRKLSDAAQTSPSYVQRCTHEGCGLTVYVNDRPVVLLAGMTVKHALISAGLLKAIEAGQKAYDEWGNEIGLDGALTEGMRVYLKRAPKNSS